MSDTKPRIIRFRELKQEFGLSYSRSHLARMERDGRFPTRLPLDLNGRTVGWLEAEIIEWIEARLARREAAMSGAQRV